MKLLFDHNLSHRLASILLDVYPESVHVRELLLERASDEAIWDYARTHHLAIVSKDSDFHQRSVVEGFPPKVIWIRRGNCTTADLEALLRSRTREIAAFGDDPWGAFLELE